MVIASALAQASELLLDEPTAALDLRYQLEVVTVLKSLNTSRKTTIVLTHDLNLAAKRLPAHRAAAPDALLATGQQVRRWTAENIRALTTSTRRVFPRPCGSPHRGAAWRATLTCRPWIGGADSCTRLSLDVLVSVC